MNQFQGDICPGNICPGDICPYQEYLSCKWPDFDETLKEQGTSSKDLNYFYNQIILPNIFATKICCTQKIFGPNDLILFWQQQLQQPEPKL